MKKVLLSLVCLFMFASTAFAGPQDFTLINKSTSFICYVYISPTGDNSWGDDILGADECLAPDEQMLITFDGFGKKPLWDLMVEDDEENSESYTEFNLLQISTITILGGGEAEYK